MSKLCRCDTLLIDTDVLEIHQIWRLAIEEGDTPLQGWLALIDPDADQEESAPADTAVREEANV